MKKLDVLNLIHSHQSKLRQLGVKSLGIFGSVARDQATLQSDVDILVELDESVGFFEFFTIKHYSNPKWVVWCAPFGRTPHNGFQRSNTYN